MGLVAAVLGSVIVEASHVTSLRPYFLPCKTEYSLLYWVNTSCYNKQAPPHNDTKSEAYFLPT